MTEPMSITIAAITSQLSFTPAQTARVKALLIGRELDPYHYLTVDVLDACRTVEAQDGWSIVTDEPDIFRMATAAGLVGFQQVRLWESLKGRKQWCERYLVVDVIEAMMDAQAETW
jgi:hypothetical protein